MSNDVPWQQLIEAIRENTEQVRKLNELLAPELKKTEVLRESKMRTERLRDSIRRDRARIRAEDQEAAHG